MSDGETFVVRSGVGADDGPPCPDAVQQTYQRKDRHGRSFGERQWTIRISSIAHLLRWIESIKNAVIIERTGIDGEGMPEWALTIYDGYLE